MEKLNQRILAVDILRGLTIIFMIVVNDPGSWNDVYPLLLHAKWNGITPTDYIFPTFLYIVGVSIVLSLKKQLDAGNLKKKILRKILVRSLKIYLVGLFLWLWPSFDFENIRWTGVLQRISIVFLCCSLLFLYTNLKVQIIVAFNVLFLYLILMVFIPIPGLGYPDLNVPEKNWAHFIDSLYLPGVLWQKTWDPEGILTTLPSIVTGIFGMISGYILCLKNSLNEKIINLFVFGVSLMILGDIISYIFPLNKNLWSSSYTLLMGGVSSLLLGFLIFLIDLKKIFSIFKPAKVFGVNSIFSYTLAGMLTFVFYSDSLWGFGFNELFMEAFISLGVSAKLSSLLYAILYVFVIWIPCVLMYKRKIYIKL
mgnify:FL=1